MSIRELAERMLAPGASTVPVATTLVGVSVGGETYRVVSEAPDTIAQRANVTLEVCSLARLVVSEGYGGAPGPSPKNDATLADATARAAAAVVIAQTALATARRRGTSVTRLLTGSTFDAVRGRYGEQGAGRWAASTRDPRRWEYEVAQAVVLGDVPQLVPAGANHFLDPNVWGRAVREGRAPEQAGRKLGDFERVIRGWIVKEGSKFRRHAVPSLDDYHLATFVQMPGTWPLAEREANVRELLAVYDDGIHRRNAPTPGNPDGGGGLVVAGVLALAAFLVM